MKKSVSIVYTIFVIIILLCIIGLFTWQTYQSRAIRISDFVTRSDEYTRRLDESISKNHNVDEELEVAENLMTENPSIVAIQISSKKNGLRLSIVKPIVKDFSQVPIAETSHFDKLLSRILYHRTIKPMTLNSGFEATFVSTTVTTSEIRSNLMIMLIVVIGMFLITFILILVNPRTYVKNKYRQKEIEPEVGYEESSNFDFPDKSEIESGIESPENSNYIASENDEFGTYVEAYENIDDFAPTDRFDENDLRVAKPEYGESTSMENNVGLPSLETNEIAADGRTEMMNRLNVKLENAAALNQDLSLVIITGDSNTDKLIRKHYSDPNLVFPIDNQKVAIIEANKDLDSSISTARKYLRECLNKNSNQKILCGIAARNGRLISADVLCHEATSALLKADRKSMIVGFRSDPEKYRDFVRNQKRG